MHSLTRRELFLSAALPALAQQKKPGRLPNIVLIAAEGVGAWMLGCYGNPEIKTPHLDLLARGGSRFKHFAASCTSSPSRGSLLTGRFPRQHGIHDFLTTRPVEKPPQGQVSPPPSFKSERLLSEMLADQGYNCGFSGRWDLGDDQTPQRAFKFWYSLLSLPGSQNNPRMSWNGQEIEEKGYLPELITRKAIEFLGAQKADQPFFLLVSHNNPHLPLDGHPEKFYQMYAQSRFEKWGWVPGAPNALQGREFLKDIVPNLRRAAAGISALDEQIAPLTAKLDQMGVRDNTLVVFTSDTGSLLGRHGLWNGGLGSDPANMYSEVVQTPLIWNWPGRVPIEGTRPEMLGACDFVPSILELTGGKPARPLPGRSYLIPAFGRTFPKKQGWVNQVFSEFRAMEMTQDTRYKLVLRNGGQGPNEFYDEVADARENVNQYANAHFVSMRDELAGDITKWRAKVGG